MDYNSTAIADILGMDYQNYNFLMGLNGFMIGFLIVSFSVLIVINVNNRS